MNPLTMKFTFVGVLRNIGIQNSLQFALIVSIEDEEQKDEPLILTFGHKKPNK